MSNKLPDPHYLDKDHLADCLAEIQNILWSDGADTEWTTETLDYIAQTLHNYRLAVENE